MAGGAPRLGEFVHAAAALERRLSQIGVVDSEDEARRLAADLAQGQRLVSRDGSLWRWDGFTVSASAATTAQARLEQRKRLKKAREKLAEAEAAAKVAEHRQAAAKQAEDDARAAERAAREAATLADGTYGEARDRVAEIKDHLAGHVSLLASLRDQATAIEGDQEHLQTEESESRKSLDETPDPAGARKEIAGLRAELTGRRAHQVECQSRHDTLEKAAEEHRQRLATIDAETKSWTGRGEAAKAQLQQLDERRQALDQELQRLDARPAEIAEQRRDLPGSPEAAEETRTGSRPHRADAAYRHDREQYRGAITLTDDKPALEERQPRRDKQHQRRRHQHPRDITGVHHRPIPPAGLANRAPSTAHVRRGVTLWSVCFGSVTRA